MRQAKLIFRVAFMLRVDASQTGAALAKARLSCGSGDVDLRWLTSIQDARDVQDAAYEALGGAFVGYTMAATTARTSRLLSCWKPVIGRLAADYVYEPEATIRLPHDTLGLGAQLIFIMGAPVREPLGVGPMMDSVLSCRMGLQILGRRTRGNTVLNDWSATADFALDVGCVLGMEVQGWREMGSEPIEISLRMGGNELATGREPELFGDPVGALVDLARTLREQGGSLQAGDIVATGSCSGLIQAVPGQDVEAVFKRCGSLKVFLA